MSDDEKKNLNGGEGDPEEAKLVSELLKKKETKPAEAGSKNIFSKKLFGTPAPTSPPKTPSAKPPAPIPPKQTAPQPAKAAPTPRPPQTPTPPAQKPPTPRPPAPAPKPPVTQAKPPQPTAPPPAKPPAPPLQPKAPPPPKMATPPPPPVQVEEEEEEDVKIVTPEDFDKIGHPAPPPQGNGLKVEGTGTKDLPKEEIEEEEDFPELVSSATPSGRTESVAEEETATQLPEEEKTAQVEEATPAPTQVSDAPSVSTTEPAGWELDSPVDESASLEELATFVVTSKPVTEEIPLKPEREPVVLKAAKDKEGPSAIEETKELIEKLDGLDEGFLDVAEVKRGLKLLEELALKVKELEARLSALEESKK